MQTLTVRIEPESGDIKPLESIPVEVCVRVDIARSLRRTFRLFVDKQPTDRSLLL